MSPSDFVSRGQALVVAGQYQEAVKVCRLGLLGRPTAVDGRVVLGQALLALRRYDEVLAEMRVALEMDTHNASAHMLKGEALLRKGDAYAASDALTRARSLAPGDPTIAALIEEADVAIAAGGGRRGGVGFGDFGDSMTKHYPSHRGEVIGEPGSKGFTKPTFAGARTAAAAPAAALGYPVGDKSGTVEIDPDIEGVEVGQVEDDEVADPPPPRASTEDVGDSDVVEVEAHELVGEGGSAKLRGKSFTAPDYGDEQATVAARPPGPARGRRDLGPLDETPRPEPTTSRAKRVDASAARSPAPKSLAQLDPALAKSAAAIDDLFPDEESRPGKAAAKTLQGGKGGAAAAAAASSSRPDDMETIRAGLGVADRARGAAPPARADSTGIVVAAGQTRPAAGRATSGTEIVRPAATPRPVAVAAEAGPRPRWMTIAWSAVAAIVLAGGVFAGFTIRSIRLQRQLTDARTDAAAAAHTDTWMGWQKARDLDAGIVEVHDDAAARAAVLRARAVLASDFGDDVAGARFALSGASSEMSPGGEADAQIARAYLALLDGDAATAVTAAAAAQTAAGGGVGDYLVGRAALLGQRWTDAAQSFAEAIKADARPAYHVALAEAEAGRARWPEATAACDKALALVPDHPRALIERARIAAASGAPPAVLAEAIAGLDKVAAEAQRTGDDARGVGPLEVALAALARAEVEHARGDDGAARRALERAAASASDDLRISDGVIALHLALGDEARAAELAQRAARTWPKSPGPRVALAAAALAAGDAAKALDALAQAGDLGDRPYALALRGRAHLAAGDLDAAAKDLDAAIAKAPDDEGALLARAEVDLARGDAKSAAARLATRAGAATASGALLVTYASSLRASGQRELARPILDKLTGAGGPIAGRAWLERARLARDDGDLAIARADFAKAIDALPRGAPGAADARVEGAVLAIDAGDVAGGRDQLDRLVADVPTDGRALVEAARAHTLLGDVGASKDLLDRAEAAATAPRWKVARERGRLAVRTRSLPLAVESLERAASLAPDDGETRLLLIDANILGKDDSAARRGLGDVLARFKGRPEAALAAGRVAYYFSKDAEAKTDFTQARDALVKAKASARAVADATYWLGRVRYDDNPDEARKLLLEATGLDPTLSDAYVFLGLIDVDKNDPRSAVTWFQKATALDPANLDTWFDLGQAAVAAKQPQIAKTAYTEYLHRAPNGDNAADARAALKKL